jgi:hypothetical protein
VPARRDRRGADVNKDNPDRGCDIREKIRPRIASWIRAYFLCLSKRTMMKEDVFLEPVSAMLISGARILQVQTFDGRMLWMPTLSREFYAMHNSMKLRSTERIFTESISTVRAD